jgi:AcrR family transcriptional regulator
MTTQAKPTSRERLLNAAATLTYREGVNIGVEALCKAAGVSKRSMYQLFESKDDLLAASLEQRTSTYVATLLPAADDGRSPRERILPGRTDRAQGSEPPREPGRPPGQGESDRLLPRRGRAGRGARSRPAGPAAQPGLRRCQRTGRHRRRQPDGAGRADRHHPARRGGHALTHQVSRRLAPESPSGGTGPRRRSRASRSAARKGSSWPGGRAHRPPAALENHPRTQPPSARPSRWAIRGRTRPSRWSHRREQL